MREECNTNNVVLDHHQSLPFSTAEKTLRTVLRCNVVMAQPGSSSPDHQPSSIPTHDFLQPLDRKALPGLPSLMRVVAPHSTLGQPSGISSNMVFCMDAASARINGPAESLESWLSWQSNPSSSEHYCMPTATAIHLMSGNGQHQEPSRTKQRGSLHSECYEMGSSKLLIVSSEEDHVDLRHADNNLLDQKKESIIIKGDSVMQKFDEKTNEDKLNSARSRHSATEQRRRSKINDRFEMLRRLVPNNDQKRDKASLLLEAIEYIQLLHEKVRKFERREPQQENNETRGPPNDMRPTIEARLPIGSKLTNLDSLNTEPQVSSSSALIPNIERVNGENKASSTETKDSVISSSNIKAIARDSKSPLFISREEDKQATNQETINVQSGSISLSSSYSQGLLENLTNALQSSGLDLSHASISVQIDLGSSGGITRSDFSRAESKMNIEQTEKSRGDGRKAETSPESGIQNKKPKLEIDS